MPRTVTADAEVVELTARLVAASSQNPGEDERAVAAVVEDLCEELGLPRPRRVGVRERPNLLVEVPFGPDGPRLGLCGHLDTKPVGAGRWETPPLQATAVGDDLRGRGVVDMKGAVAAMLLAAADLNAAPPERGTLVLVLCADEEDGATYGGQWLAANHLPGVDAMIIGEPGGLKADWDRLHLGSRGICNFDVDVVTQQGHSGLSDVLGLVSATEVAARLILALRETFQPPAPRDSGWKPLVNPGVVIEGGINYGVVPGWARVRSECRLVPGMHREDFEKALADLLATHVPTGASATATIRAWLPAAVVPGDHAVAAAARRALVDTLGTVPPDDVFPGTTDATWFAGAGIPTLPALGPGLLRHAHAPDETVSISALSAARQLYGNVVRHFCGGAA